MKKGMIRVLQNRLSEESCSVVSTSNLTVTVEGFDQKPVSIEDKKNTGRLVVGFVLERW